MLWLWFLSGVLTGTLAMFLVHRWLILEEAARHLQVDTEQLQAEVQEIVSARR